MQDAFTISTEFRKNFQTTVDNLQELLTPSNIQEFEKIATDITELYRHKNADYGDSFGISIHKYGLVAALTRLSDKFNRAEQLILNGEETGQVNDERLEDTLLDMASYAIMTVIALREMKPCSEE